MLAHGTTTWETSPFSFFFSRRFLIRLAPMGGTLSSFQKDWLNGGFGVLRLFGRSEYNGDERGKMKTIDWYLMIWRRHVVLFSLFLFLFLFVSLFFLL